MEPAPRPEGYTTGRPTLYRPEYCEQVIDFMAQGYSLTAFGGSIRVSRETLHKWQQEHPEFSDAVRTAQGARCMTLEDGLLGTDVGPRVTARIFALKNAAPDEWKERQEDKPSKPIVIYLNDTDKHI